MYHWCLWIKICIRIKLEIYIFTKYFFLMHYAALKNIKTSLCEGKFQCNMIMWLGRSALLCYQSVGMKQSVQKFRQPGRSAQITTAMPSVGNWEYLTIHSDIRRSAHPSLYSLSSAPRTIKSQIVPSGRPPFAQSTICVRLSLFWTVF